MPREFKKSHKLNNILYDIRGPALETAARLEEEGYNIMHLNIGNTAPFGFYAPDKLISDVIHNINNAQGYCNDSKGILPAREAIVQYYQEIGIKDVETKDVYIGNGVSELITLSMQALLDINDEILIPAPDYPLWTAAVNLSGGKPVHYLCDESADWNPDIEDIKSKITSKTKGIVVINPNNPTGAVYPKEILEQIVKLAQEHQLIIFSDEMYEKIIYDNNVHIPAASITDDILFITFNGLSKAFCLPGFRAGWMVVSGNKKIATDYIQGLNMLSSMRLCSNVPVQYAIQASFEDCQSIKDLTAPGGRLRLQRDYAYSHLIDIPGVTCVKPRGALYCFPRLDVKKFNIKSDEKFVLDLLLEKKIILVRGKGFNWPEPDHFRIVFLPPLKDLKIAIEQITDFLKDYRQE